MSTSLLSVVNLERLFSLGSLCLSGGSLFCYGLGCGGCLCGSFCLTRLARTTGCLLLGLGGLSHFGIEVNELDEANLSSVTLTGTQLDDTGVATRTVAYLLRYLAEELLDGILVLQLAEHYTT